MNDQIVFDRLAYVDKRQGAGIPADQARAHADALDTALRDRIATKADVTELGTTLRAEIAELRAELKADFGAVRSEITSVRNELKSEIAAVRNDLKTEIARVETKMDLGFRDATIRTGGMFVVAVGIMLGAMKFFIH